MRPLVAAAVLAGVSSATAMIASCGGSNDRPAVIVAHRVTVDGCGLAPENATGFSIEGGLLVTVAHVLAGDGPVTVDGRTASVIALDTRADLALVSSGGSGRRVPRLRAPETGETVQVLQLRGDGTEFADATIRQATTIRFHDAVAGTVVERAGAVLSVGLVGGDSGSPAIGADGKVVGVMFANAKEATESYAVSATEVIDLLDRVDAGTTTAVRPPC